MLEPTRQNLLLIKGIDEENVGTVMQCLQREVPNLDNFPQTQRWVCDCLHPPTDRDICDHVIAEILGIDWYPINIEDAWVSSYYGNIVCLYVGTQDIYDLTILFFTTEEAYMVGSYEEALNKCSSEF